MDSKLQLYYHPLSAPCRFVHILLLDGNVPFEKIDVDLFSGQQKSEEYLKINPNGTIPSLVDGELALWESHAIGKYLVDKFPSIPDHWYPRNDRAKRALVDQWLDWHNNTYRPPHQLIIRPPIFNEKHHPDEQVHAYVVDGGRKKIDQVLDLVERHFTKTGNRFLVGSEVTLADIGLHLQVLMLTFIVDEKEVVQAEKRPHFAAWYESVPKSVPHWEEINATFYAAREDKKKGK